MQKSFGGVLVQGSAGSTAHKSPCRHRERGPSPQPRHEAVALQGRSFAPVAERGCSFSRHVLERGRGGSRGGHAKRHRYAGPRRQSRGISEGLGGTSRLGNEARRGALGCWTREGTLDRGGRWRSRAGGGSGLGGRRFQRGRESATSGSAAATGVPEARSSTGAAFLKSQNAGEENAPRIRVGPPKRL